jgi:signal transduction histidine kinase
MSPIDNFLALQDDFEHLVRTLDLALLIEHIRRLDGMAFARHFKGYRPQMLGRKRVIDALRFEVYQRKNETVAEILILLWNQEHRDLYQAMLALVRTIREDVENIEKIEDAKANDFVDELLLSFDKQDVHACIRLNEVRFSPEVILARFGGGVPQAATPVEPSEAPADKVD